MVGQKHLIQSLFYNEVEWFIFLTGYCTECESQHGCLGTEWLLACQWLALLIMWLTDLWLSTTASYHEKVP